MEGDLVAQGGHGCDMDFVGSDLQTPKCTTDMWLAIQAVDSEATSLGGHSKGGIKAAMQWCGQDVYTDDTWECSTVAEEGWQNPIADGYDPLMEFDDAVPPYGADLTCRHRELPSCSWVRRNTNVVTGTEQASECAAMGVGPSPLCKEEALLADCASLNSASACSGYVDAQGRYSGPAHVDAEGRGVCRWKPSNPQLAPCGAGTCVLDLTCSHFSKAGTSTLKETDKEGKTDDVSNVLDSKHAEWIWVDKDAAAPAPVKQEQGPGSCAECGPGNFCSEETCHSVDPVCKFDPERRSCRMSDPVLDEDTVCE